MSRIDRETGEVFDDIATPVESNTYEVDIATGKVTSSVYTNTEIGLAELRKKYPATLTADDYQIIAAGVKEVRKLCINLESARKEIKAPFLKACTAIDKEAKRITIELEKISDPMIEIKKRVDDAKAIAEAQRLAELDAKAALILRIAADAEHGTLAEISLALEQVSAIDTLNGFYERQLVACENKAAAMATLKAALIRRNEQDKLAREADAARQELAAARAKLAKQQAETDALLAAELAKAEAERLAQAEELREEREELAKLRAESEQRKREEQARIDAEAEAKLQAEIAERRKAEEAERMERQHIACEAAELAESEAEQVRRKRNKPDTEKLLEWHAKAQSMLNVIKTDTEESDEQFRIVAQTMLEVVESAIFELTGE